jgi:chorismate dehydratase
LPPLRISIVEYLNTAPLVRGFTHGPLRGKYQLSFTVPSQCAEALRTGAVDIAIIPAIEYSRIEDLVLIPRLSIASKKSVRSLLLISKKPLSYISRIALDQSSRSTQVLTRILCQKHWGIAPEFFEAQPDLKAMLQKADAALVIGDPALRLAISTKTGMQRDPDGVAVCTGFSVGLPKLHSVWIYDIVEEWHAMTALPAVLAVWAGRRDTITPEVEQDFQESLAFGMQQLDSIVAEAVRKMNLPAVELRRYLTENIDYTLDTENVKGLAKFYDLAAQIGAIPEVKASNLNATEAQISR